MNQYLKEYIDRLKAYLHDRADKRTVGGCDTCGYGGTEVIEPIDIDALYAQMDEFSKTFEKDLVEEHTEMRVEAMKHKPVEE